MIVHESILTDTQRRVLRVVAPFARRAGFYLAGGTAVALRFGHRRSDDFDWFIQALPRPDVLLSEMNALGVPLQDTQTEAGTLIGWVDGVKVSFFEYRYPLLDALDMWPEYDIHLASVRDMGAMKLLAIAQRGSRKDFVDVHELLRNGVPLRGMLDDFREKLGADPVSALRGLTYFDDAEAEPMPEMLKAFDWRELRAALGQAVREVVR